MTWSLVAKTEGFPLRRHNVFFSRDYAAEFDDIFRRDRLPREPTVYVCAQDRDDDGAPIDGEERLLVLVNAPANGDRHSYDAAEIEQCATANIRRAGAVRPADPAAAGSDAGDDAERTSTGCFRRRAARCTAAARTDGRPRSSGREREPEFRACIWRGAARIRARACRWRRCRAARRRRACSRT